MNTKLIAAFALSAIMVLGALTPAFAQNYGSEWVNNQAQIIPEQIIVNEDRIKLAMAEFDYRVQNESVIIKMYNYTNEDYAIEQKIINCNMFIPAGWEAYYAALGCTPENQIPQQNCYDVDTGYTIIEVCREWSLPVND